MGKKPRIDKPSGKPAAKASAPAKPSALLDTRVIYCGDCLEQLQALPAACVELALGVPDSLRAPPCV